MGNRLHVGNLPSYATEKDLLIKFGQFGTVKSTKIVRDERSGRSRCFGFVEMSTRAEAAAAINRLNFAQYDNRTMSVSLIKEQGM